MDFFYTKTVSFSRLSSWWRPFRSKHLLLKVFFSICSYFLSLKSLPGDRKKIMLQQNLAYFDRPPRSDKIKSENRQKINFFTFLVIKLTWCDQKLMKICMSRAIFGARAHCNAPRGPAPHIWRKRWFSIYFGIFRNILEYFEIFRNIPEYFKIFRNILNYFGNISKYFGNNSVIFARWPETLNS